jgi:hypothetical protein
LLLPPLKSNGPVAPAHFEGPVRGVGLDAKWSTPTMRIPDLIPVSKMDRVSAESSSPVIVDPEVRFGMPAPPSRRQ